MSTMPKEYSLLFNGITTAINEMEHLTLKLKELQMQAEETYMNGPQGTTSGPMRVNESA